MVPTSLWLALSIAGLSLITEDGATALAAGVAGRFIDTRLAFVSCFLGIWLGDLGLYAAARSLGQRVLAKKFAQRFLPSDKLDRAEQWFRRRGIAALVLSRIVPGSRLPTYVAAGMLKMPFAVFAGVTAVCAAVWVGAALLLAQQVPGSWTTDGSLSGLLATATAVFASVLLLAIARPMVFSVGRKLRTLWRRYRRWEFWPGLAVLCASSRDERLARGSLPRSRTAHSRQPVAAQRWAHWRIKNRNPGGINEGGA